MNYDFNNIAFENIKVGMSESYTKVVTDADVKAFAGISGDRNPIHMDEIYAETTQFKKRIAHGLMSASYFSALFGMRLPGPGCVYVAQSLKFLRPVYIDDKIVAIITVKSIDFKKRRVFFKTICEVSGKKVIMGEAEIYIPESQELE